MSGNNATTTPGSSPRRTSPPRAENQQNPAVVAGDDGVLAAEDVTEDDASIAQESLASSTTSVTSSVLSYRLENGRTYHKYRDGKYPVPNDERENERLDLQHHLVLRTFDDRLGTSPPNDPGAKVGRVLDVGTGSGIWAIDFGEEHPESEVIGVDLSAVQPAFVPPNVQFQIDNIEEPWTFSQPFDYIHSRMMTGSIGNWEEYIQNCYQNLAPGGYLELNDIDAIPVSDDGTLTEDTSLMKSVRLWAEALAVFGTPFEQFSRLKAVLEDVGFEDVRIRRFKWPTNGWPRDQKHKQLGMWNYENLAPNWEGLLMASLTRALNWTREEVLVLVMEARKDFGNREIHGYFNFWSIHGRKPEEYVNAEGAEN